MTKEHFFRFFGAAVALTLLAASCLNPIDFNPNEFVLKTEISGSIEVSINDVAVFWLINRTKDVNVEEFKIEREQGANEKDEEYTYPKVYPNPPQAGTSHASYHAPMETPYTVSVVTSDGTTFSFTAQFPRAQDYRYYLYWAANGSLVLVDETKLPGLPPDPTRNHPDEPAPTTVAAHTMVVLNVTPDQDIDAVEFTQGSYTYTIANEPRAKDQEMISIGAGSYETVVTYTRNGTPHTTTPKTAIVTQETGSMAVRTNFLYFYKTRGGNYQISPVWPPIPNDAADDNKPEDALNENQGILEIVNNAVPNNPRSLIARILINNDEHPNPTNTSSYLSPTESRRYIVPVGDVHIAFKPQGQTYYGQAITREIRSRQVTVVPYTNDLGNPWVFPGNTGHGAGLIQIINNSRGTVLSAAVYNPGTPSKSISLGYEDFEPPYAINYRQVGLVPVVGTKEVDLGAAATQLIQVVLQTTDGLVVVEQLGALNNNILTVEITDDQLKPNSRVGSKVTVKNETATQSAIMGMYVYNKDNTASLALYGLNIPNGSSNVEPLYVLSTTGLPIVSGGHYAAKLSVYSNGKIVVIDKEFLPNDVLYSTSPDSHVRTITLTETDLPKEPVTGITALTNPLRVITVVQTDLDGSNPAIKSGYAGTINLNASVKVEPDNATKKSPIIWTTASNYVSIDNNGVLTVTNIAPVGGRTVIVDAKIQGAGSGQSDFTTSITVTLEYLYEVRTVPVTGITLSSGMVESGHSLDLKTLAALSPASGANINGVPITKDDLVWYVGGSQINGSVYAPSGNVQVYAVLPANKNGGTQKTSNTVTITVTTTPVPVTGITAVGGGTPALHFYTQAIGSAAKTLVGGPYHLTLDNLVTVTPSNATDKTLTWTLESTNPTSLKNSSVTLSGGVLSVGSGAILPSNGNTARVKVVSNSAPTVYIDFDVTLVEHHSRLVGSGELTATNTTITVGEQLDLRTLAGLPSGAYIDLPNSTPGAITANDLTWQITSVGNYGSLSGATLTGTSAGTVTVQATLPAAKNGGSGPLTATGTITVKAQTPANFTLRIIKQNTSDYVSQIILVPVPTALDVPYYNASIYRTGHTKVLWATTGTGRKDTTYIEGFKAAYPAAQYPNVLYINIAKLDTTNDWADVSIPWPTGDVVGYNLFFIEGDSRVRGYVNPGQLDPALNKNFIFYLRLDYLYNNNRLWMNTYKQAAPNAAGAIEVVPIGYDSYYNTASIMKAAGVGNKPTHDLSDF
jgi:hypothetical protein